MSHPTAATDSDLFARIAHDDSLAFQQVFRQHYKRLVLVAMRYLTDRDQSENIVQQVFVKFWEQRKQLQVRSVEAYLLVSVRNSCHNEIKHMQTVRKYEHQPPDTPWEEPPELPDPHLMDKIYQAIEAMPEQRKKIFKMNRLDGMKYKEIAQALQLSPKTVEVQIGKALKHLRETLAYLKSSPYFEN
ncbi:RNA polymerase sigma-70 factor (ECF subfamily) [Breznakibacter xylanolyticus]|uniref:RNA polymerase sigma-70 factor (ECF subfamily) n=1 Tax=Breznakibacter xylanolyticus TaxID=990 RepID=A0A2W7NJ10_9BACT|nr:RNA polymerase sigma-70 factor [Breznakibacter xylanolyticus]MBN2742479.1 RNA polymerase sigma-70 factor [Marinilabiliaceae bacterium]PZX11272.1 RNA polymerase sigma-70 factor (ECF subfamily) [Breznakibacter xylanolyticus]